MTQSAQNKELDDIGNHNYATTKIL